jgi:hypothetical protein
VVPVRLGLEELVAAVVAVLAVVIPALHAARDKQAARVTAAGRYLFIVVLTREKGCAAPNLDSCHARRIPNVSQACDIQRDPGTCNLCSRRV